MVSPAYIKRIRVSTKVIANCEVPKSARGVYVYTLNKSLGSRSGQNTFFSMINENFRFCMSKQSCPVFIICPLYKNGQDFMNIPYNRNILLYGKFFFVHELKCRSIKILYFILKYGLGWFELVAPAAGSYPCQPENHHRPNGPSHRCTPTFCIGTLSFYFWIRFRDKPTERK